LRARLYNLFDESLQSSLAFLYRNTVRGENAEVKTATAGTDLLT